MADSDWIILCDYAFPALHGKLCMIGAFDTLFAATTPVTHPRAAIAFNIIGEPGEKVAIKLKIIGPIGDVLQQAQLACVLPDAGSVYVHLDVQNLVLKDFGRHAIEIELGEGAPRSAWFTLRKLEIQQ